MVWFSVEDRERLEIERVVGKEYVSWNQFDYTLRCFRARNGDSLYERLIQDERMIDIRKSIMDSLL